MNELIEKLKFFKAEKDLTIHDVAILIKKDKKNDLAIPSSESQAP